MDKWAARLETIISKTMVTQLHTMALTVLGKWATRTATDGRWAAQACSGHKRTAPEKDPFAKLVWSYLEDLIMTRIRTLTLNTSTLTTLTLTALFGGWYSSASTRACAHSSHRDCVRLGSDPSGVISRRSSSSDAAFECCTERSTTAIVDERRHSYEGIRLP